VVKDTAAISSRLHLSVGSPTRPGVLVTSPSCSALPWPPDARELDGIPPVVIPTSEQASRDAVVPRVAGGVYLPIESATMAGLVIWEDAGVG
jgi:hypothetical protein